MTDNQKQDTVSLDAILGNMQDRHAYLVWKDSYRDNAEVAVLVELLGDVIDDGSDEQERLGQEASNKVLIDFSRTIADTDVGGRGGGSRPSGGAVPTTPGIVTRRHLCNSPPVCLFSSSPKVAPKIKHGGFDGGAKNCFFGMWGDVPFTTLTVACESGKTRALSNRQSNPDAELEPEVISLAGRDVIIYPSGSRIGCVYYDYHLCFEGFDVFIHKDKTPKNKQPQIWVDYRSESILTYDSLYRAQAILLDFLSALGFTKFEEGGERVSRLDIQVMIDVPVSAFTKLYLADHDVSKGRNFKINGKKKCWGKYIETFETGSCSKRVQLCVYDKRAEIHKKENAENAYKYEKTKENIGRAWWDSGKPITRIEFRLGREALNALEVESLEDFRVRERGIVQYLTHHWFRLLEKPKVRGTESEAPVHLLWRRVQKLFEQYFSCAEIPPEKVKWKEATRLSVDSTALGKQGLGCYSSAAAPIFGVQKSVAALRNRILNVAHRSVDSVNDEALEKYNKRVRLIEVTKGVKFEECATYEVSERVKAFERFDSAPELRLRE